MKISEILQFFEALAPFDTQAQWDNSGFLTGDKNSDVSRILVCLDVTRRELEYAKKNNCGLIVSHHPVIFKAKKSFTAGDVPFDAAVNGISIISLHTNLDKASGGVNDTLCEILGFPFKKIPAPVSDGFLNIVELPEKMPVKEFAGLLKKKLHGNISYNEGSGEVKRIGVCSGSGAEFMWDAFDLSCDAFLTGEAHYHEFLDAEATGLALFTAGHFETEEPVVKVLSQKIRNTFTDLEVIEFPSVSIIKTE